MIERADSDVDKFSADEAAQFNSEATSSSSVQESDRQIEAADVREELGLRPTAGRLSMVERVRGMLRQ